MVIIKVLLCLLGIALIYLAITLNFILRRVNGGVIIDGEVLNQIISDAMDDGIVWMLILLVVTGVITSVL